nr:MAG TPA: Putative diphthamide synthesis protein [Bacteriophage sp.]
MSFQVKISCCVDEVDILRTLAQVVMHSSSNSVRGLAQQAELHFVK